MKWPWDKEEEAVPTPDPNKPGNTPPEKTPTELIAESIATALRPVTEGMTAMRAEMAEMRKPAPKPPAEPQAIPSVIDDEEGAFTARVTGPLTGILQRQLELEARVVLSDIKAEFASEGFGPVWKKYETEINKTITESPLVDGSGKVLRGSPDYIRNVVYMILGRAAKQNGLRYSDSTQKFTLEDGGGDDGGNRHVEDHSGMSEKQKKIFLRMGVPLDKAGETLKRLEFVS
jgi:hypothetical protein